MKAKASQVEKQRRLVGELRRRLAFETLVLQRMEGRGERSSLPAPTSISEILERVRGRDVETDT